MVTLNSLWSRCSCCMHCPVQLPGHWPHHVMAPTSPLKLYEYAYSQLTPPPAAVVCCRCSQSLPHLPACQCHPFAPVASSAHSPQGVVASHQCCPPVSHQGMGASHPCCPPASHPQGAVASHQCCPQASHHQGDLPPACHLAKPPVPKARPLDPPLARRLVQQQPGAAS
jgi:hypothetical protein